MRCFRVRTIAALAAVSALALPLASCGGEDNAPGAPPGVPAAGENTPPAGTPGVPEGASYDVDGTRWLNLKQAQQFAAADDYIADNPDICEGADVGQVVGYTTTAYGYDFPRYTAAAEVLSEACAASLQS